MATFTAGTSFTDGVTGDVTASKLNALVANATPLANLITDRTAETSIATDDLVLISDTSDSGALNKMTVANLMKAEITGTINSTAGTITTGVIPTLTSTTLITSGTGTAASPAIVPTGDTNTGIFFPAADTIAFSEGGTEGMRIDSSGNVGIGNTSPATRLHVKTTSAETLRLERDGIAGQISSLSLIDGGGTSCRITSAGGALTLDTNGNTERLRITSGGDLLVGTTTSNGKITSLSSDDNSNLFAQSSNSSFTSTVCSLAANRNTTNSSYNFFACTRVGVTTAFVIHDSGNAANTNNSYGAISDIKLKENIEDASSQWNDIKSIQVRKFSFKNDEEHKRMIGLVAQEVELISPHLVESVIDRDKDGNDLGTTTKEVKYSVLYMKAVKALQEAMERIEQLESKVAALEAA